MDPSSIEAERAGQSGSAPENQRPRRIRLEPAQVGERLDRTLAELLPELSRTRLKELILDGGVFFEGECLLRPSHKLETPGVLELHRVPRSRERSGAAPGAEPRIVFEDDALIVIDKPAGQIAHPTSVVRGGSVSEWARERFGTLPSVQGADRPGIVHRLDADTSGLMLLARTQASGEALLEAFRERRVDKSYLALVHGEPRFDSDWIEVPIGRSRRRSDRMSVIGSDDEGPQFIGDEVIPFDPVVEAERGLEAATFYLTRERLGRFAFIECRPKTGRTHQIRVHLTHIAHPLVGDRVYPGKKRAPLPREAPALGRHALHAASLGFAHPVTGERVEFHSELPKDMQAFLDWARGVHASK